MQKDTPKSFNLSGITSDMTKNGKVRIAQAAMKMTNEKLTKGIQLNASTSNCHDFNIMYDPSVVKPKAVPMVDTANKN